MERFVRFVVGGGIALVTGLWLVTLFALQSVPGTAGAGLAILAAGSLAVGIWSQLEVG